MSKASAGNTEYAVKIGSSKAYCDSGVTKIYLTHSKLHFLIFASSTAMSHTILVTVYHIHTLTFNKMLFVKYDFFDPQNITHKI